MSILQVKAEIMIGEELDYSFDYTKTLALVSPADTIASSTWVKVGNITLGSESFTTQITTQWVAGAVKIGEVIRITNTAVTAGGRTHVRLLILKVVNRYAQAPDTEEAEIV